MKLAPPRRKSTIKDGPGGLEVNFPTKRNVLLMVFLTAWLGGWAMGEIAAARLFLSGPPQEAGLFMVFWLVCWTACGGFFVYVWLWMLAGRERVILRPDALLISREVLGFGRVREFDLAHVSNLRVTQTAFDPWSQGMQFWGIGGGHIAFDYGAKTLRFAAGIDEAEAARVVGELKARHGL